MNKKCTQCGRSKNINDFRKRARSPGGIRAECKECQDNYQRKYYQSNSAKVISKNKEWVINNPERSDAIKTKWRQNHPEVGKNWARNNPDKIRDSTRKQRLIHPERSRARKAVQNAITRGDIKKASEFICRSCNIKQASQYHHYLGYEKEHWLDVVPLCRKCHKD